MDDAARVALYEALREFVGAAAPIHEEDRRPWGFVFQARPSAFGEGADRQTPLNQIMFERHVYPPRQFSIKLRGQIGLSPAPPVLLHCLPMGVFTVETSVSSDTETFSVDAEANDSILTVFAERVRVTVNWDLENIMTPVPVAVGFLMPQIAVFSASLSEARSFGTARRTRVVSNTAIATVPIAIPRGSRGIMIRTPAPATVGSITWSAGTTLTSTLDVIPAGAVVAAHDAGQYLPIPSWADTALIEILAVSNNLVLAEFEIRPV